MESMLLADGTEISFDSGVEAVDLTTVHDTHRHLFVKPAATKAAGSFMGNEPAEAILPLKRNEDGTLGSIKVSLLCDSTDFQSAMLALSDLAKRFPEAVQAFLRSLDPASELLRLDCDDLTAGTGNVRVFLQPSDLLVHFLAAFRTGDRDGD